MVEEGWGKIAEKFPNILEKLDWESLNKEREKMTATQQKQKTIGQYLLDRLNELGVEHIFGVPGDYVLKFDKLIEKSKIQFINATSEMTAGYMADAYARTRGLGAACITYGVGITIANALAQAYVESSPLVVISGTVGTNEDQSARFHDQPKLRVCDSRRIIFWSLPGLLLASQGRLGDNRKKW
jgi:methylmalonyl-CoA mutase cobalamin-binding subunit